MVGDSVPKLLNWFPGEGHGVKYGSLLWATTLKEFPAVRHSTERVTRWGGHNAECGSPLWATAPNAVPRCGLQRELWSLLWPLRRIWFPAVDRGGEAAPVLVVALWLTQQEEVLVPQPTVLVQGNQVLRCGSPSGSPNRKKFCFHGPLYSY